jgi:hypothetical protein
MCHYHTPAGHTNDESLPHTGWIYQRWVITTHRLDGQIFSPGLHPDIPTDTLARTYRPPLRPVPLTVHVRRSVSQ